MAGTVGLEHLDGRAVMGYTETGLMLHLFRTDGSSRTLCGNRAWTRSGITQALAQRPELLRRALGLTELCSICAKAPQTRGDSFLILEPVKVEDWNEAGRVLLAQLSALSSVPTPEEA